MLESRVPPRCAPCTAARRGWAHQGAGSAGVGSPDAPGSLPGNSNSHSGLGTPAPLRGLDKYHHLKTLKGTFAPPRRLLDVEIIPAPSALCPAEVKQECAPRPRDHPPPQHCTPPPIGTLMGLQNTPKPFLLTILSVKYRGPSRRLINILLICA